MPDDTLQSITRRYHLDRNWRRLWNTNPEISNPFVALHDGHALNVGPIYRVRQGDTLGTIAGQHPSPLRGLGIWVCSPSMLAACG